MLMESEIIKFMDEDRLSKRKKEACVGQKYYEAEHDINAYRIFYIDSDGKAQEDKFRSNIKISHAFFSELIDQKTQYMLSGKDGFIKSEIPELQQALDQYFDDAFQSEIYELISGCSVKGFEYMYAYKAKEGKTAFNTADAMGVVEVEGKYTSDGEDYVIYHYLEKVDAEDKKILRIQVWNHKEIVYYTKDGEGKLIMDDSVQYNPRPHVIEKKEGEYFSASLGYIPFFRLDNNRKQLSDLKPIKALIDDYDLMSCGLSNNLQDMKEAVYVVKGFQGDNIDELLFNLKAKKHIAVDSEGGVDAITVDIPYEARKVKLELDEKNIYRFGMGFNASSVGDGNITNVVIKSRYALLDMKCNKMEIRLKSFMKQILQIVLDEINTVQETAYTLKDVKLGFTREIITNEADNAQIEKLNAETQQVLVNTLLSAASQLDSETLVEKICNVLEIDFETIKDKLDFSDPKIDLNQASEMLEGGILHEPATATS